MRRSGFDVAAVVRARRVNAAAKALAELRKPAAQRNVGGHGDPVGFALLVETAGDVDLYDVELPLRRVCSTCRFLTPEFHDRMACWDCVTDGDLPKWRPRSS